MRRAVFATRSSFARCCSRFIGAFVNEANPHCVEIASSSSGRISEASEIRPLDVVFGLQRGILCREQSEHHGGARCYRADRAEVAGAAGVVLEQDDVYVEIGEK